MSTSVSGIYKIKHIASGKIYIGSAINIKARWAVHITHLKQNGHHSRYLQRAWNKYGADAFEFSVIETCFIFALIWREQFWMDKLKPEYNISKTAGSSLGVKKSAEQRAKNGDRKRGTKMPEEQRLRLIKYLTGRKASPETKAKMTASKTGHSVSTETRTKISAAFTPERRKEISAGLMGHIVSLETRAKQRLSRLAYIAKKKAEKEKAE